jgi:hypothetical protein
LRRLYEESPDIAVILYYRSFAFRLRQRGRLLKGDGRFGLSYNGSEYTCISEEDCDYTYDSRDMVYLFSLDYGQFSGMGDTYDVYRHIDDEDAAYLFVIPNAYFLYCPKAQGISRPN